MVRRNEPARSARIAAIALAALALVAALNWVIQAARKPSEVLFPFDGFTRSQFEDLVSSLDRMYDNLR